MQWGMVIVKPSISSIIHRRLKKVFSFKIVMQMDIGTNRNFRINNISINKLDKKRYKNYLSIIFIKRIWNQQNLENLKEKTSKTNNYLKVNSTNQHKNILFINNMAAICRNKMDLDKT
jgi:hypothetical protein